VTEAAPTYRRNLALLVAAVTVCRLLAARWIHLTEDEAYYRLWAQHLHLGYYDHPPMIAWWIRAGQAVAGDNPLGVRLLPSLAAGAATWLVAEIARKLGAGEPAALRAAVWYNATITIGVGGILAAPDAPATFFSVCTLWALAQVWAGGSPRWWVLAGLAAGLACISKYSALFLAPGVLLWLACTRRGRAMLATPWPWLAVVAAAAVFSTNILWNAQHGWLTFAKQFGRVSPRQFKPAHLGDLLVTQFFLLNPLIAILAARGTVRAWRSRDDESAAHLWLPLAAGIPFAAYLVLHSLHDRVQAHWPVPLFAGVAIIAAAGVDPSPHRRRARIWRATAIGLTLGLSALALTYAATAGRKAIGRWDPILPIRGWSAFAVEVEHRREASGAAWVGTSSYGTHAQLSATRIIRAPLIQLIERERFPDPAPRPDFSRPGLIVDLARRLDRPVLLGCFREVTPLPGLERGADGGPAAHYEAYLASGPRADLVRDGCPNDLGKAPR